MTPEERNDINCVQVIWEEATRCLGLDYRLRVSDAMATRWLACHGMEIIEFTLLDAVKNWKRKRERDGADFDDLDYLRNYCQAAMRNNREAGKFQVTRASRVACASSGVALAGAASVEGDCRSRVGKVHQ